MTKSPVTGDVVLVEMPANWHPELGIRIYPAIVLYPNPGYGPGGLDLQVFAAPYDPPGGYHISALPGQGSGRWQPKHPNVNQQPLR